MGGLARALPDWEERRFAAGRRIVANPRRGSRCGPPAGGTHRAFHQGAEPLGREFGKKLSYVPKRRNAWESGEIRAPVCAERVACRVPDRGKTMCQKFVSGKANPTPMNLLSRPLASRRSRTEVTKHLTDSTVASFVRSRGSPGVTGASSRSKAPSPPTFCVKP